MHFLTKALCLALASVVVAQKACTPVSTYTVVSGDYLSKIADDHGVTLAQLEAANPQIKTPDLIQPGDSVGIPSPDCVVATPCVGVSNYTVKSGDSLDAIATANKLTVDQILAANPDIKNPNFIQVGQNIALPDPSCVAPPSTTQPPPATATCSTGPATYTVVSGDTFFIIAQSLGITLQSLEDANPTYGPDFTAISPGQVLNVPVCPTTTSASPTTSATCVPTIASTYTVQSGDTLYKIAGAKGITLDALEAANPQIPNFDQIAVGQVINIPSCSPPVTSAAPTATSTAVCTTGDATYTVQTNDNLSKIAESKGITLASLEAANSQIKDFDLIYPGQVINIPICGGQSTTVVTTPTCVSGGELTYVVKSGDTLSAIAQSFNVCLESFTAANPQLQDINTIVPGQTLNVPKCGYVFVLAPASACPAPAAPMLKAKRNSKKHEAEEHEAEKKKKRHCPGGGPGKDGRCGTRFGA